MKSSDNTVVKIDYFQFYFTILSMLQSIVARILCVSCGSCKALICDKELHRPQRNGPFKPPVWFYDVL